MKNEAKDPEEQRAATREELASDPEVDEEQTADDATLFAPPGHLGERMNEGERREKL